MQKGWAWIVWTDCSGDPTDGGEETEEEARKKAIQVSGTSDLWEIKDWNGRVYPAYKKLTETGKFGP
jgi:hypothetical protein